MYEELIKSLRWLTFMFPETHPAKDDADRMSNNIHLYCQLAADAIEVLSKTEKTTRWIPVTERLPEEPYGCLAVVWDNPRYGDGDMFLNYYPEFIGWDGETWNDADGEEIPFDVVYWMRLPQIPEPPKEE